MSAKIDLHDAELTSLTIEREARSLVLNFVSSRGQRKLLRLDGIFHFRAVDVLMQNVVSRVLVSVNGDMGHAEISNWILWTTSFTNSRSFMTDEQLENLKEKISKNELVLLVIEPSCGLELAAIAGSYSLSKGEPTS